jgi:hypothetical protein
VNSFHLLGWREWISLPELGIDRLKCKVDTGAKTSALHAFYVDSFLVDDQKMIRFGIHPVQGDPTIIKHCEAKVIDERVVTSSDGNKTLRYVIETTMILGDITKKIQVTLTNRDNMRFRMLLGRRAIDKNFIVNPSLSYQDGKMVDIQGKV